jgi:hypothetical protein
VRATRAYLAGFGTSGSLLAGAALMFLLASAFVAFQGWPQVAGQSGPALVSVPRVSAPAGTRASRALSATTAAPTRRASAGTHAAQSGLRPTTHVNPAAVNRGSDQTTLTPVSRDPGTSTGHPTGPTPTPRTCLTGCGHPSSTSGPVPTVKKTVQGATQNAGSAVGNTVTTVRKVLPVGKSSNNGGVVTTATNVVKGAVGGLP